MNDGCKSLGHARQAVLEQRDMAGSGIGVSSQSQSMANLDGFTSDRYVAVRKIWAPGQEPPLAAGGFPASDLAIVASSAYPPEST